MSNSDSPRAAVGPAESIENKLRRRRVAPAVQHDAPEFLLREEAARIARTCTRTIDRWLDDGRFKSTRPVAAGSGRRLIDRASFLRFLGIEDNQPRGAA